MSEVDCCTRSRGVSWAKQRNRPTGRPQRQPVYRLESGTSGSLCGERHLEGRLGSLDFLQHDFADDLELLLRQIEHELR